MPSRIDSGTTHRLAGCLDDLLGPEEAVPRVIEVLREDVKREDRVHCRGRRR